MILTADDRFLLWRSLAFVWLCSCF